MSSGVLKAYNIKYTKDGNMKNINGYWVDDNHNRWDENFTTEEQSEYFQEKLEEVKREVVDEVLNLKYSHYGDDEKILADEVEKIKQKYLKELKDGKD